jgi:putative transcription regulator
VRVRAKVKKNKLEGKKVSPSRIQLARKRRSYTKASLAEELGVSPRAITDYEESGAPLSRAGDLAHALDFPKDFFLDSNEISSVESGAIHFRATRTLKAKDRAKAESIIQIASLVEGWINEKFYLPEIDIDPSEYHGLSPREVSKKLRTAWEIPLHTPMPDMIKICEAKGIRVFTLPEFAKKIDAFSVWYNETPFIFLSRLKTPERVRFDIAHELGHLLMHIDTDLTSTNKKEESEANEFASNLLIPFPEIESYIPKSIDLNIILKAKKAYGVSAAAMEYALWANGFISDWNHRSMCVDMSKMGYRSGEPGSDMVYEVSQIFQYVYKGENVKDRISAYDIAKDINVPINDIIDITFNIEPRVIQDTEIVKSDIPFSHDNYIKDMKSILTVI